MDMPYGYMATTAFLAWCTFFAVVAPRRPRPLATVSFWSGMVLNEAPFLGMFAIVASTALAAAQGDLDSPTSKVTAAVALATFLGLLVSAWRGLWTDQAVLRSLDQGLGTGWRDHVQKPPRRRPWARILLLPGSMRQRDVERIPNIRYGDAGRRNLLDIYRRRDTPQNGPVLIYFHGGGYTGGAKSREARPLLYRLAGQGWVCISANYRLRPQTAFPGHQIDAKKVITWVREHGHEYGADPSRLFVAGSSAGSNLAALCALTPNDPTFQPGFEQADTSVTAAICLYGYYGRFFGDEPDATPSPYQPYAYLNPGAPPFFIAHGTKDALATVEGARHFVDRLRAVSDSTVVYAELSGGQHAFDLFHSPRFEAVVDGVEAFATWVLTAPQNTPDSTR
ncbi:alpha/beta hydrolase [Streptomyces sp. ZAF1911]|uniref:alpha/beta hydrolase n=1 Tax=Streptomyces sp. ZAF1911 TaxID=2944129 RepID=UPI00237BD73B|nr:alpha/beta hydrolase [Streptomyces sp. ZAF1911]MDD9381221.1 alpha/beta hydrolase [Streptomyces sp. ZAF1911]